MFHNLSIIAFIVSMEGFNVSIGDYVALWLVNYYLVLTSDSQKCVILVSFIAMIFVYLNVWYEGYKSFTFFALN